MCFMWGLRGGINTFCNNIRMTGMGSLWHGSGLSLSVWPYTAPFVSGGNPVREAERTKMSGGDGCWKKIASSPTARDRECRSIARFQSCFYFVICLCPEQTQRRTQIMVQLGQGQGKEQDPMQGRILMHGFISTWLRYRFHRHNHKLIKLLL